MYDFLQYLTKSVVVYSPSKIKRKEPEKITNINIYFDMNIYKKCKKLTNTNAKTF
jgi:hypothetical protein